MPPGAVVAMGFRYLLFDLDGTLIDTTDLILNCYRSSISKLVDCPPSDEEILKGFGTPLPEQLCRLYPGLRDRLDEMVLLWRAAQEELHDRWIRPFEDTTRVLEELLRRGYRLGIVTSKERPAAERDMALYGLDRLVEVAVCLDDTTNHKPHPEPILTALELMSADPGEALYTGDSLYDMKAGRGAGTMVAAALWGPFPKEPLLAFGADFHFASISELLPICPPLNGKPPS